MNILILTEKNSIAKEIISALTLKELQPKITANSASFFSCSDGKNKIYISSSGGHLGNTEMLAFDSISIEEIPFFPSVLEYKILPEKKLILREIKKIATSLDKIIHFGDCGQEGEIIQRKIIKVANLNKKICLRAWYSEITPAALKKAYDHPESLQNKKFENLGLSGEARIYTDWIIGMNYSYLAKYSIGRVMTPTIYAVYQRCLDLANHIKTPFWYLTATTNIADTNIEFRGKNFDENLFEEIIKQQNLNIEYKQEGKKKYPENLYNLNTLQVAMGKFFNPKKTLEIAQTLYEKGFLTYPRTEESKLSPNDDLKNIETIYKHFSPNSNLFAIDTKNKRIFLKEGEVPDHTAIIPTKNSISKKIQTKDEEIIFNAVLGRFLENFSKPAEIQYLESKIIVNHQNQNYELKCKLQAVIKKGFLEIYNRKEKNTFSLDTLNKISKINKSAFLIESKKEFTKPKPLFTEATLIRWMDKECRQQADQRADLPNGIGTVATRANIVEKCINKTYIEVKNKHLLITDKGKKYCELLKDLSCNEITTAKYTAEMEAQLKKIRIDYPIEDYLNNLKIEVIKICDKLKLNKDSIKTESKYLCPFCSKKLIASSKGIFCKADEFYLPKILAKTDIEKYFEEIIKTKQTKDKIKFTSKKNTKFQAKLKLQENKLEFDFDNKESKITCPSCEKNLEDRESYIFCNACRISLPKIFSQINIEKHHQVLLNGETLETTFISKKNKKYTGRLNFDIKKKKLELNFN